MPKIVLAIDSSTPLLSLCASNGKTCVSVRRRGIKQEQYLLPLVQKALGKLGADLADVEKVFIVRGPGRFTGIRIGLTFASVLASLNGAQVFGATVFEIIRRQCLLSARYLRWRQKNPQGVLAVVLHAFREEYFLQIFDAQGPRPAQWLTKEALLESLKAETAPLYIAGQDNPPGTLKDWLSGTGVLAPAKDGRVQAETMVALAAETIYKENALEPLYLKPARFELGQ